MEFEKYKQENSEKKYFQKVPVSFGWNECYRMFYQIYETDRTNIITNLAPEDHNYKLIKYEATYELDSIAGKSNLYVFPDLRFFYRIHHPYHNYDSKYDCTFKHQGIRINKSIDLNTLNKYLEYLSKSIFLLKYGKEILDKYRISSKYLHPLIDIANLLINEIRSKYARSSIMPPFLQEELDILNSFVESLADDYSFNKFLPDNDMYCLFHKVTYADDGTITKYEFNNRETVDNFIKERLQVTNDGRMSYAKKEEELELIRQHIDEEERLTLPMDDGEIENLKALRKFIDYLVKYYEVACILLCNREDYELTNRKSCVCVR